MRKRITEKNVFPEFSLEGEYKKLHDLTFDRSAFGKYVIYSQKARPSLSYDNCLQTMFLDWDLRGSFTSIEEMLFGLQISEDDFDKSVTEERLLDFIQFTLNAICFVDEEVDKGYYNIYKATDSIFNAIVSNSRLILDHLGAEMIDVGKELVIVYKDDVATAVSEQNRDLKASITEYLKIDNRGDIQRKGEVLCTLAKKLEPHEKALNDSDFKQLCSDTTFLLNNIGARHYPDPSNKIKAQFTTMKDEEVEEWYDRTFQMFLACMAVVPYLEVKSEIKALKSV